MICVSGLRKRPANALVRCAYAQAGLSLCQSRIPHCWQSYVEAQIKFFEMNFFADRNGWIYKIWHQYTLHMIYVLCISFTVELLNSLLFYLSKQCRPWLDDMFYCVCSVSQNWLYVKFTFVKSDVLVPILHMVWNFRNVEFAVQQCSEDLHVLFHKPDFLVNLLFPHSNLDFFLQTLADDMANHWRNSNTTYRRMTWLINGVVTLWAQPPLELLTDPCVLIMAWRYACDFSRFLQKVLSLFMYFLLFHILNFDIIYKSVLGVRRYLVVSFFCFVNVVIFLDRRGP